MKQSINKSIKLLELCFGIHLSKQQRAIIQYDLKTPVRVISCAGSGKTMLFLFMALALIVNGQTQPKNVLGITFSKRAQLDMGRRYNHDLDKMRYWGADKYIPNSAPYFTTFHALFYRLLKTLPKYKDLKVIVSYIQIGVYLCKGIRFKSKEMSKFEQLSQMFTYRNQMLNKGLTFNGLDMLKHPLHHPSDIFSLLLHHSTTNDKQLKRQVINYRNVMKLYNIYKRQHHLLDFSDMMTKLYMIINRNMVDRQLLQDRMKQFHYVFLDEFQDINDLQWRLLRELLSKEALSHLMIIGDDDQSIYSFRGSNPNIILTFEKMHPKTHTFLMSTNYRTGGNILHITVPMIEQNHYRLDKKLETGRKNQGKIVEFFSHKNHETANQMMLSKLWRDIKSPKVNNNNLAILVHYNNSRMFVIDWLATHHKYVKVTSKKYLLQHNYIYRIIMNGVSGLVLNDIYPLSKIATKLGKRSYSRYILSILNSYNNKHIPLTTFLHTATQRATGMSSASINQNLQADELTLQESQHKGSVALEMVRDLTKNYFTYMIKHHYLSKILVKSVFRYLDSELATLNTKEAVRKFIYNEQKKYYRLKSITKQSSFPIHIMSLHQSKGLQFKVVFLYDINRRRDSVGEIDLEKAFAPNLTITTFLRTLHSMTSNQREDLDAENFEPYSQYSCSGVNDSLSKYVKNHHKLTFMQVVNKIAKHNLKANGGEFKLQQLIWQFYRQIIHSSKFIEEQRRLIYVGITRAQNKLYIAYNDDADPILDELDISNRDKKYLEENGKIVGYTKDVKIQRQIRAKLRAKMKKEKGKHHEK